MLPTPTKAPPSIAPDLAQEFEELYQTAFPAVAQFIGRRGGTLEAAKDVFHDALIGYYEQVITGNTQLEQSPNQYLFGIARHLWLKRFRHQQVTAPLSAAQAETVAAVEEERPLPKRIQQFLAKAGQRCMRLLTAFYYHKHSMEDIAATFQFSSAHSAAAQKYKCLEKMRQEAAKRKWNYADFTE